MDTRPRLQSSKLSAPQRRVYAAATIYFVVVFAAMMWPIYPWFARARPLLLGMPFGLFYLAALVVVSFGVALALFVWELRSGVIAGADER